MKKLFLLSVLMLLPMLASADAVEIDGIWYNLITKDDINWAEVTSNPQHYKGSINIPDYVNYEDVDYVVKSIGTGAFASCWELNSVTLPKYLETIEFGSFLKCTSLSSIVIPDNVIQIGSQAFQDCLNLSSVTLPRSLKSVGSNAFYDCSRPININIPDLETWCNLELGVTIQWGPFIEYYLFVDGKKVEDLVIPNTLNRIGNHQFDNCIGIKSIQIPNSVQTIGEWAFSSCKNLSSVTFPNTLKTIETAAFAFCHNLSKLEIPNSVTIIGGNAFSFCEGLTSLTIPSNVSSIGGWAFYGCPNIMEVKSYIKEPFDSEKLFDDETYRKGVLFIPKGTKELYCRFDGWRQFLNIEEMDETEKPYDPNADKCATPIISYSRGKLIFGCETEGAEFVSDIVVDDMKKSYDAIVDLTVTYKISVYAHKEGLNNSDVVTATLCWIDVDPETEGITNNVAQVRAKAVLIQSSGSMLSIAGADEETAISVYDVSGKMVGSATAASENTNISTSLRPGDIALVKIGNKTIKVVLK